MLILGAGLTGCRNGQNKTISGSKSISRDQMIRLMADIELTEAALKIKQVKLSRDSVKIIAKKCYDSLYQFYGITPEQFTENLKYYQRDLEDFQAITDSVIINLTRRKDSLSNLPKTVDSAKIRKTDTLKSKTPDKPKTGTPDTIKSKKPVKARTKIRLK